MIPARGPTLLLGSEKTRLSDSDTTSAIVLVRPTAPGMFVTQ